MGSTSVQGMERRQRREQDPAQLRWIAQARSLAAAFDLLATPILLLRPGEPIAVWHANAAARHRFADCSDFCIRNGLLQGHDRALAALGTAIAHTRLLRAGEGHGFPLDLAGGVASATLQRLDFGACADLPVSEVLMLEVRDVPAPGGRLERLCTTFGLTPKEAEVAIGLYSMGSVDQLARCTGRSVHTIRSQLKAAMQKTGRRTQAALVAAVADCLVGAHTPRGR